MRTKARLPVSLLGIVLVAAVVLLLRTNPGGPGGTSAPVSLPIEDAQRMGVQVEPITGSAATAGLIDKAKALSIAAERWSAQPAERDAFLQLMTDPDTLRGDEMVMRRPVWVIRYGGLSVTSPGGRELHFAYVVVDARTGVELLTKWAP